MIQSGSTTLVEAIALGADTSNLPKPVIIGGYEI